MLYFPGYVAHAARDQVMMRRLVWRRPPLPTSQLTPLLPLFVGCGAFLKVLFVFSMNYLIYIVGAILLVDSGAPNL